MAGAPSFFLRNSLGNCSPQRSHRHFLMMLMAAFTSRSHRVRLHSLLAQRRTPKRRTAFPSSLMHRSPPIGCKQQQQSLDVLNSSVIQTVVRCFIFLNSEKDVIGLHPRVLDVKLASPNATTVFFCSLRVLVPHTCCTAASRAEWVFVYVRNLSLRCHFLWT